MTEPSTPSDTLADDADAPETLTLPLDGWHRGQGARMVEFAGYWMPIQYDGIMAEHMWTREHAGLFDVSHMGQLYISGDGAEAALEALLPIDLATLGVGQVRYSLLLNADGGILDDLMVTRWQTGFFLIVNGATKWDDIAHLREHMPDDVTINLLDDSALLALQGPEAAQALQPLVTGETALADLVFMKAAAFKLGGVDAWISRSGYTGEDGFEISVPAENAEAIASLLCQQAQIKPIGLGARDSLRLEAGLPLYGHDLDETTDPVEAGLKFAIAKRRREQGGFLGHAHVMRRWNGDLGRLRVGLMVEAKVPVREGAPLFAGAQQIGNVTSGGFAPSVGAPIAMGYVALEHSQTGRKLEAEVRGKRVPVTVCALPFVPHNYVRQGASK